jgi:hypothetical protein
MACTPTRYDRNCGGCRHCADHGPATPGSPGILHHDAQAEADARVWRRHVQRRDQIRNRGNN